MDRRRSVTTGVVAAFAVVSAAVMTPAHAHARPPGFPVLESFVPITDTGPFEFTWRGGSALSFTTPDGSIACLFDAVASCNGVIPALPTSASGGHTGGCPYVSYPDVDIDAAGPYELNAGGGTCPPFLGRPLAAGHRLVTSSMTCGVGNDNLVACIDSAGKHGFVLQPSGSWAF
jgi:hypothetical protein